MMKEIPSMFNVRDCIDSVPVEMMQIMNETLFRRFMAPFRIIQGLDLRIVAFLIVATLTFFGTRTMLVFFQLWGTCFLHPREHRS